MVNELLINLQHPSFWTAFSVVIGLGILFVGGSIAYIVKQRNEINKRIKKFEGDEFLKKTKEQLIGDYKLLNHLSLVLMCIAILIYLGILYDFYKTFTKDSLINLYSIGQRIIFIIAFSLFSFFLSLYNSTKLDLISEYAGMKIEGLNIPSSLKRDIKKFHSWWKKGELRDKDLKDSIISTVASEISRRKK